MLDATIGRFGCGNVHQPRACPRPAHACGHVHMLLHVLLLVGSSSAMAGNGGSRWQHDTEPADVTVRRRSQPQSGTIAMPLPKYASTLLAVESAAAAAAEGRHTARHSSKWDKPGQQQMPAAPSPDGHNASRALHAFSWHETHVLLSVLFHALLPALQDTAEGRPPLSATALAVLQAAQEAATLAGLNIPPATTMSSASAVKSTGASIDLPTSMAGHPAARKLSSADAGQQVAAVLSKLTDAVTAFHDVYCGPSAHKLSEGQQWVLNEVGAVRRTVIGVLHGLYLWSARTNGTPAGSKTVSRSLTASAKEGRGPLQQSVQQAGRALLLHLVRASRCAIKLKTVGVEMLHVSKSGGTTMCELARLAGVSNPSFDPVSVCVRMLWTDFVCCPL